MKEKLEKLFKIKIFERINNFGDIFLVKFQHHEWNWLEVLESTRLKVILHQWAMNKNNMKKKIRKYLK